MYNIEPQYIIKVILIPDEVYSKILFSTNLPINVLTKKVLLTTIN